ncbi:MAG: hypothetical protein HKP61_03605 [Dactylosporangium sp.]|nr:hypothetical protein [Dactylosporangium sp.]NNJ60039.1 hypothetical protein [Dactylosporangium sp.]
MNKTFAGTGGGTYDFIKNFKWTNTDQNEVADTVGSDKLGLDKAAKQWTDSRAGVWKPWLPR